MRRSKNVENFGIMWNTRIGIICRGRLGPKGPRGRALHGDSPHALSSFHRLRSRPANILTPNANSAPSALPRSNLPNLAGFPDFEKLRAARIDSARTIGGRVAPCQIDDAPSALLRPHAARRPHLDGGRHSSREAAAAANKGTSPTHSDPQVRTPHCTRLAIIHQQALTRTVWMCVRAVA